VGDVKVSLVSIVQNKYYQLEYLSRFEFAILNQQNSQYYSLDIYIIISHWIFLHVSILKESSLGNQTKETPIKPN